MTATQSLLAVLLAPLASAAVIAFFLRRFGKLASFVSVAAAGLICVAAVQMELNELVAAVDRDILRPIAQLNFGRPPQYDIHPRSLLESFTKQMEGPEHDDVARTTTRVSPPTV